MFVLIKHVINNIFGKAYRTVLVLLTICIAGSAMFASVSISDTMIKTAKENWRYEYGDSDIIITSNNASPTKYFDEYKALSSPYAFENVVKKMTTLAMVDEYDILLSGYNLENLIKMTPMPFVAQNNVFPFEGRKIIISEQFAKQKQLSIGNNVTVKINGNKHIFEVCAIATKNGPFYSESSTFKAIIPYKKMQACLGQLGKVQMLCIKLENASQKSNAILALTKKYKGYQVREAYSADYIQLQNNRSAVPFVFMSVLLCLMAMYVIYIIFQQIVTNRMNQMSIFRAIGATKNDTKMVILLEALIYGLIGAGLSIAIGSIILYGLARQMQTLQVQQGSIRLAISIKYIAITVLLNISMSGIGAMLALNQYKDCSISAMLKQQVPVKSLGTKRKVVLGGILVGGALATLLLAEIENGLVIYTSIVAIMILGVIIASKYIYRQLGKIIKCIFNTFTGGARIVSMALHQQSGYIIGATIVSIIVTVTIVINTITYSSEQGQVAYYQRLNYELELTAKEINQNKINVIGQLEDVQGVGCNFYSNTVGVKGQSIDIYRIQGIKTDEIQSFIEYKTKQGELLPFKRLNDGKNIFLTEKLKSIYRVDKGDTVILEIFGRDGIYREVEYKIIGFFNDNHTKLGQYALISEKNFKEDFKAKYYDSLYIQTNNQAISAKAIKNAYFKEQIDIQTIEEMKQFEKEEHALIISGMRFISYLSMATGILGLLFVMLLSFNQRKKELTLYYAMGLTQKKIKRMLMLEMIITGINGSMIGCGMGCILSFIALPKIIQSLKIAITIYFSEMVIVNAMLLGVAICGISAILGTQFFDKLAIIEGLRDE